MRLRVTTPIAFVVDVDGVRHVRLEDTTGSFGVQRGHAPFVTLLAPSVVTWRGVDGGEHHVAVRRGVLSVFGDLVVVATREAVAGGDLAQLERDVVANFRREEQIEQTARGGAARLQAAVIRRIYQYLQGERPRLVTSSEEDGDERR
jgi:F-type H+-transporting ATPase subunit epsilon